MSDMIEQPKIRTEDLKSEEISKLFVATAQDREIVKMLKAATPTILEGSRGTGKSFLMKIAEIELEASFQKDRILPVYLSFTKSSLVYTGEAAQFHNWMMSRLAARVLRTLQQKGLASPVNVSLSLLAGGSLQGTLADPTKLESLAIQYEQSFKHPDFVINDGSIPSVDDFKDAVEDICKEKNIDRICVLFDEAVHIFRPEQQRQFFTLFRDLRSPYISCNAAVYPGVTSFGPVFELAHDATLRRIERDVLSPNYLEVMREIANRQVSEKTKVAIEANGESFNALAYAVTGNPRLLLKTISLCPKMNARDVNDAIKTFYRAGIWSDHTTLSESFLGHRPLLDWGRDFIEKNVLPETRTKNDRRAHDKISESTAYFWVHRDAPEKVKHALRLLAYTGIVQKGEEGVRGTRSELGTRYMVNIGCLISLETTPVSAARDIVRNLSIKRWSEFGANHPSYPKDDDVQDLLQAADTVGALKHRLQQSVALLDVSEWQRDQLTQAGLESIGDVLKAEEETLIEKLHYVGEKRARRIKNAADAAVLEYLSG